MKIYPYNSPIILNDALFSLYGGQGTGTFTSAQLQSSYLLAEMQVSEYIGTLLLPTTVTGTYPFMYQMRLATDYGYVSQLLNVTLYTKTPGSSSCDLTANQGCGYVYQDTFGYIDFKCLLATCRCGVPWWGGTYAPAIVAQLPYQVSVTYVAGLPTGTANQPGILEALTILAQTDLNEKFSGAVGVNESVGAIGVTDFKAGGISGYQETRAKDALIKTALGDDARAQRAKKLIDMTIRRARKALFA